MAGVVAQGADVADVVVQAFELQEDGAHLLGLRRYLDGAGILDRPAVGEGVADRGVPRDPLGDRQGGRRGASFSELLESFVDVPEAGPWPWGGAPPARQPGRCAGGSAGAA